MDDFNIIDPHKSKGELILGETNETATQKNLQEIKWAPKKIFFLI